MKVRIRDKETGAIMDGTTRLSPERFAVAFAKGYDQSRFSYVILYAWCGIRVARAGGIDPADIAARRNAA